MGPQEITSFSPAGLSRQIKARERSWGPSHSVRGLCCGLPGVDESLRAVPGASSTQLGRIMIYHWGMEADGSSGGLLGALQAPRICFAFPSKQRNSGGKVDRTARVDKGTAIAYPVRRFRVLPCPPRHRSPCGWRCLAPMHALLAGRAVGRLTLFLRHQLQPRFRVGIYVLPCPEERLVFSFLPHRNHVIVVFVVRVARLPRRVHQQGVG